MTTPQIKMTQHNYSKIPQCPPYQAPHRLRAMNPEEQDNGRRALQIAVDDLCASISSGNLGITFRIPREIAENQGFDPPPQRFNFHCCDHRASLAVRQRSS